MVKKDISENLSASLALPKIIARTLGFDNLIELINTLKKNEGYEYKFEADQSNFMKILEEHLENIPEPFNILDKIMLRQYDLNIKEHIEKINQKRDIIPKVFQYVSLLVTEIYLDNYFKHKKDKDTDGFLIFLNQALKQIEKYKDIGEYDSKDLEKLCFWMATGSGKTIIMHINYYQYMYYAEKYNQEINNIILITPNEDLSKQHQKELRLSNIDSILTEKQNYSTKTKSIKIIDINKIAERSQVKRISYKAFGNNNLIMVDEGHRGGSGVSWLDYRNKIAKEGFTFEYSATFQDLKTYSELVSDYKKTILFDYSYKYYHKDGYGKDYFISNIDDKEKENETIMMLGNLISYYEQKKLFLQNKKESETTHLIEEPLWILVGSKVVEKDKESVDQTTVSDIIKFVEFLNNLKLKKKEHVNEIKNIFENKTSLKTKQGEPFFQDKYIYLKNEILPKLFNDNYEDLLKDIFKIIFYSDYNDSNLVLDDIKESDGELGLRYESNRYFGLIYVGKGNDKKILDSIKKRNILTSVQSIKKSLFKSLNEYEEKPLNVLIGAKKFIEGWDNFRISSMLLMNFAKSKGVSAIQLFGRGVRLRGYKNSMKRSSHSKPPISKNLEDYLKILETLNVFGIKANYMDSFRDELSQDIEFYIEKEILIEKDPNNLLKDTNLKCIKKDSDINESFKNKKIISIKHTDSIYSISLEKHLSTLTTEKISFKKIIEKIDSKLIINDRFFELVDWENILSELRRFKRLKDLRNISLLNTSYLKKILYEANLSINGNEEQFRNINNIYKIKEKLEQIYIEILKKIIFNNYNINLKKHYDKTNKLIDFNISDDIPHYYKIKIFLDEKGKIKTKDVSEEKLMKLFKKEGTEIIDIKELQNEIDSSLISKDKFFIDFDKHLFFPLLLASNYGTYTLNPSGLNVGEVKFIEDLKKYIAEIELKNNKIIILRNHEKTGFGYYLETGTYYPDFIMWVLNENSQKIIFLDPKGIALKPDEEKINFNKRIKEIELKLKEQYIDENFELFSFIIAISKKAEVQEEIRENSEEKGIYFREESDYLKKLFEKIGVN